MAEKQQKQETDQEEKSAETDPREVNVRDQVHGMSEADKGWLEQLEEEELKMKIKQNNSEALAEWFRRQRE